MMFIILGLAFLNMFSIGLAMHTMKFDIHYKSVLHNIFIFISLMAIIAAGITTVSLMQFHTLAVSPESLWASHHQNMKLPPLTHTTEFVETEWYPLTKKF